MANVQSMSISREISAKDQHFADIYIGGSNQVRGSAKACYKHLHPRCKDSTAATEGPALLRKPQVRAYLEQQGKKLAERAEINAAWVLEQSIRLYNMCMGDEPYPVEFTTTDKDTGEKRSKTFDARSFNAAWARGSARTDRQEHGHRSVQRSDRGQSHSLPGTTAV